MRIADFLKIAAEAEILRLRHMLARQGRRAAFGAVGAFFGLSVVVLADVICWQLLHLYVTPIYATLILLGVNLILTAIFAALAHGIARSAKKPPLLRRDALQGHAVLRSDRGLFLPAPHSALRGSNRADGRFSDTRR
jgi:hypothetical protein